MIKQTKVTISLLILAALILGALAFYKYNQKNNFLPTYFNYSATDYNFLSNLNSNQIINQESLKKWDSILFGLIKQNKLGDIYASRIYAYVYTAQRDAAFLSKNVKHTFMGSIEPISAQVLCVFFPGSCSLIQMKVGNNQDPYSNMLAELVLKNVKTRIEKDKNQNYLYTEKKPPEHYWAGVKPYYGQDVGSWLTWIIKSGQEFVAPPPPDTDSPEWQTQIQLVKTALKNNTTDRIISVVFWAGNPSTITPPGIWLTYANDYMIEHHTNLAKMLYVRSVLAMGITDSLITVFNSKYIYWTKRPFMRIPDIHTVMPTPNHPSYPAAHSTLSATAATILTFYFPENAKEWKNLSSTASEGRVWGGIHFPLDAKEGFILGNKVGNVIIIKTPALLDDE